MTLIRELASDTRTLLSCDRVVEQMATVELAMQDRVATGQVSADEVCTHLLHAGGKRLRPVLVLLAAKFGPRFDDYLISAASAMELLHLATLHHDDVIDRSAHRRQQPSVNAKWGNSVAVHAGTYLFARAMEEFGRLGDEVNRLVSQTLLDIWRGQMREIEAAYRFDSTPDDHLKALEGKTALMYELACRLGASLSGAQPDYTALLAAYGRDFGVAFQLTDDLLDFLGDEASLGKPVGSDLRDGVYTLPVLYALHRGDDDARKLRNLIAVSDQRLDVVSEILEILWRTGSFVRARETAGMFVKRAKQHAWSLPSGDARDTLVNLADELPKKLRDCYAERQC